MGSPRTNTETPSNETVRRSASTLAKPPFHGADPAAASTRPQFGSRAERRRLHQRRGRDPSRHRFGLRVRCGTRDADLEEHGGALAVRHDLSRERMRRPRRAQPRSARRSPSSRPIPLAPFASSTTASLVEHSPSTEMRLKLASTRLPEKRDRLAGLERVVGRDDREHRGEPRMDHPGPLRHPADDETVSRRQRLLGPAVGREDRGRGLASAVGVESRRRLAHAGENTVQRKRNADDSRREHDDLLGDEPEGVSDLRSRSFRVGDSRRARRRVRDARVDNDRLRLGLSRCRFDTTTGAASTRFVVHTAAPTDGTVERTSARSGPERRMPACTPAATNPSAAVTDIRPGLPRAEAPSSPPARRGR